jgi:predicted DCC family thiol-disulfide oxidoreductase YuxK
MLENLLGSALAPMEFEWSLSLHLVGAPDFVLVALAVVAVLSELLFAFVLFSPLARRLVPMAAVAMHLGILFLQNILFLDLILLQAIFYDFSPLRRTVGRWLNRRGHRIQVLYDGRCGLCGRAVRVLTGFDLFERLAFLDFRTEDLTTDRGKTPEIDPALLEHEMAVILGSRTYWGFAAYRVMAWSLPACWVFLPLLYLPGVPRVGDAVYRRIAERRHAFCGLDRPQEAPPLSEARVHLRGARAALLVAGFLLSWWTTHIEFYPLTTMKMFTGVSESGKVDYLKANAIYENGRRRPARFEQWIGAMADGRYKQVIERAFHNPPAIDLCNEFLEVSIRMANRGVPPGDRVVGIELQSWEWDFAADPDNPNHGHLEDRYEYHAETLQ